MKSRTCLLILGVAGFVGIGGGACEDLRPPTSAGLSTDVASIPSDAPFYYYQGQKVFLSEEPGLLVVRGQSPVVDAQAAVVGSGAAIIDGGLLPAGHRLLQLSGVNDHAALEASVGRLRSSGRFDFVSPAFRTIASGTRVLLLDQVDVRFKQSAQQSQIDDLINQMGLRLIRPPRPDSGFFAYRLGYAAGTIDPLAVAAILDRHALVQWADPGMVGEVKFLNVPTDPYYSLQYYLKNSNVFGSPGVHVDDNVEAAWSLTTGAKSIHVVVIDDGIDVTQQDLMAAMGGGMSWDLMGQYITPGSGENAYTPYCDDAHGTAIAGMIGAAHNGIGTVGIAPGITLSAVRIGRSVDNCPRLGGPLFEYATPYQIADGINWAWQYAHADVISNSWSIRPPNNNIDNAIYAAATLGRGGLGTVVVFAAGNPSDRSKRSIKPVDYPATNSLVIAVGAIDRNGIAANYTPDGPQVAIVALSGHDGVPTGNGNGHNLTGNCQWGGDVVSTDLWGPSGCNAPISGVMPAGDLNYLTGFSGTSAAAPQVAAVAALLLSREPNLTASQVRSRLTGGADPWGVATTFGAGKLNAGRTLGIPPLSVTISGQASVRSGASCAWFANVTGTPPYTYDWRINTIQVSNGSSDPSELIYTNSGSSFTIAVYVTDAASHTGSSSKSISISGAAPVCHF